MNYKGCIHEVVAVASEVKAFELEEFKASWYLGPKPDTFIFFWGIVFVVAGGSKGQIIGLGGRD